MDKMRPIRIFWQDGVTKRQIIIVVKAIKKVLKLAEVEKKIKIQSGNKISDPIVHKVMDVRSEFFGHYNAGEIINEFSLEQQLDDYNKYYTIFLMKDKIFMDAPNKVLKPISGVAIKDSAAIVCVGYDFVFALGRARMFSVYCITMHELGHIFNLPSEERKVEIELSSINQTRHCANDCIMYPALRLTLNKNVFCPICLRELRDYFKIKLTNFGTISP